MNVKLVILRTLVLLIIIAETIITHAVTSITVIMIGTSIMSIHVVSITHAAHSLGVPLLNKAHSLVMVSLFNALSPRILPMSH